MKIEKVKEKIEKRRQARQEKKDKKAQESLEALERIRLAYKVEGYELPLRKWWGWICSECGKEDVVHYHIDTYTSLNFWDELNLYICKHCSYASSKIKRSCYNND